MQERWRDVVAAIQHKKHDSLQYRTIHIGGIYHDNLLKFYERKKTPLKKERILKNYYLNEPFINVYFTHREIQCLNILKLGLTNREAGERLGLSERTVEFYIRNMRDKTGCMSKVALLEKMHKINFTERNPTLKIKSKKSQLLRHKNTKYVSNP